MDHHATASTARGRRATAPKPVRRVARAARLTLREPAEAIIDGQPPRERPRSQVALLHWLSQSVRNGHPGAPLDQLAATMTGRLQGMVDGEDATAKALLNAAVEEEFLKIAQIEIALAGARWAPHPPAVAKQERQDAIASTVLELTGWESVDDETVQVIYRWLFGDEALFVARTEMRVAAGLQMLEAHDPRPVRVPHPDTGELVLVTREEIIEHAEADGRVLEAAQRYEEKQLRYTGASSPHSGHTATAPPPSATPFGGRPRTAGSRRMGGFEALAGLVVAAAEARAGSPAGEQVRERLPKRPQRARRRAERDRVRPAPASLLPPPSVGEGVGVGPP